MDYSIEGRKKKYRRHRCRFAGVVAFTAFEYELDVLAWKKTFSRITVQSELTICEPTTSATSSCGIRNAEKKNESVTEDEKMA